jgi:broad specificity phosphatase PhoE
MGDWTGMTYEEIVRSSDGQLFRRWYDDPWTLAPPNGETLKEVAARIRRGLRDLLRLVASLESGSMSESSFRAPLVCLVAHKTPLKAVQSMLSGNELKLADESSSCVENGSYLLQSTTVLRLRLSSAAAVQNGIPPEHRSTLLQG